MHVQINPLVAAKVPLEAWREGLPGLEGNVDSTNATDSCFTVTELTFEDAIVQNNKGYVMQMQGEHNGAIARYQKALETNPLLRTARRNLATLLVRNGQRSKSFPLWYDEIRDGPDGLRWIRDLLSSAMCCKDLTLAGEFAELLAELRWGSSWYPLNRTELSLPALPAEVFLTIPKLQHDIEQFEYLQRRGILGDDFSSVLRAYQKVIDRLTLSGADTGVPLTPTDQVAIGHIYNRIIHVRGTQRLPQVFSGKWDANIVEKQYIEGALGLVIIDDFLSLEAIENVRLFCLESTVWNGNRFAHGRFGAFFQDGFSCPLLVQIAEKLRWTLPRIIGDRHPLRELWGFKCGSNLAADATNHADFAAINVNFWITPESSNFDPSSGGMVVYAADAPVSMDWDTYNAHADQILRQLQPHATYIPYRQNRAIIFNSDLFHATAAVHFHPGYENRRINITMLYGDRGNDIFHHNLLGRFGMEKRLANPPAWRSPAFRRIGRTRPVR